MASPIVVKTSEIQTALNRLWEKLEGSNKMRACLFNLIFYTEVGPRQDYIRKIAHKVIEKFPSRVILISSNQKATQDSLTAKIAVLTAATGESSVACDLIELDVSGKDRARVPFVVLPLILPDLPVFFLWGENPSLSDTILNELGKFSTRLIFDSETACSLPQFGKALLKRHQVAGSDVADLNWARTESWRDVLSSTFCTQKELDILNKVREIKISFNAASSTFFCHTNIQALYLQSWLAGQLGWRFVKVEKQDKTLLFTYERDKKSLLISVSPTEQAKLAPGMICSLELTTENTCQYHFAIEPDQAHKITRTFSTSELCELPCEFLFPRGDKGQSLVKEICHRGMSAHYLRVLEEISKIDEALLC